MKEEQFLTITSQLWLSPEEYAQKKKVTLRAVYYWMRKEKVKTMWFKGKQLIRDEAVRLSDLLFDAEPLKNLKQDEL